MRIRDKKCDASLVIWYKRWALKEGSLGLLVQGHLHSLFDKARAYSNFVLDRGSCLDVEKYGWLCCIKMETVHWLHCENCSHSIQILLLQCQLFFRVLTKIQFDCYSVSMLRLVFVNVWFNDFQTFSPPVRRFFLHDSFAKWKLLIHKLNYRNCHNVQAGGNSQTTHKSKTKHF